MGLRCEDVRDRFSALCEDGLSPVEETEAREHLNLCLECQKEFERFGKTLRMLHSVQEVEVPEAFLTGLYEKMEKRTARGFSQERPGRGGFIPSRSWRVPAQALAMVAIVFFALYLTQRMPNEPLQMKGADEAKLEPSPSADQAVTRKTPAIKKEDKQESLQTSKKKAGAETGKKGSPVTQSNASKEGASMDAPATHTPPPALTTPQPHPLKAKKGGDRGEAVEMASQGLQPSQEIVLKSHDPGKRVSQIQELVKQFQGKLLGLEGNSLLVSIPGASLQEFRRQLERDRPSTRVQALPLREKREEPVSGMGGEVKEIREKDREPFGLGASGEERVIIRVVVIEE